MSSRLYAVVLTHAGTQRSTLAFIPPNHASPSHQQPSLLQAQLCARWAEPLASPCLGDLYIWVEISLRRVNCALARPCPLEFGFFLGVRCYLAGSIAEAKAKNRTHVFPNILRSKAVSKENNGYCYLPGCQHSWDLNSHMVHDPAGSKLGSCHSPGHGTGTAVSRAASGAHSGGRGVSIHPSPAHSFQTS